MTYLKYPNQVLKIICTRLVIFFFFLMFEFHVCSVAQLCLTLATPWTVACQDPLSMEFSRQEYWSGLPFPFPYKLREKKSTFLTNQFSIEM